MICKKCGNEVNTGADFCPKCGASMMDNQSNAVEPVNKISRTVSIMCQLFI